jgi:hypothetical protein
MPPDVGESKNAQYLGKSIEGVSLATICDNYRLRVFNLVESNGQMDWELKHNVGLHPLKSLTFRDFRGFKKTWTLDDEVENDDEYDDNDDDYDDDDDDDDDDDEDGGVDTGATDRSATVGDEAVHVAVDEVAAATTPEVIASESRRTPPELARKCTLPNVMSIPPRRSEKAERDASA